MKILWLVAYSKTHHDTSMNFVVNSISLLVRKPVVINGIFCSHSIFGIKLKDCVNPCLSLFWNGLPNWMAVGVVTGADQMLNLFISSQKWWYSRQNEICNNSDGPYVTLLSISFCSEYFWCNILDCPAPCVKIYLLTLTMRNLRHSKINNLYSDVFYISGFIPLDQDIIDFQVSMDNSFRMKVFTCSHDLVNNYAA